jgi:hypothetical protein
MGNLRQSGTRAAAAIRRPVPAVVFAFLALSGCRELQVGRPASSCQTGVIEIALWDGYLQSVCNCGTDGAFVAPGAALTCSFPVGSKVFVYYNGPKLQHQFVSVGTPAIPSGPIFDPNSGSPIRVHAFTVDTVGAYSFRDAFYGELNGTLTVTP